ncbi:YqhR family membrane protein [Paenibacillus sp. BC26]|uniref:YqhR family membrane protein n=1 Tax=Paenibacillus sp. BC26 TaxID=1881032 RepID=UPI0008EFC83B|nr:YqhR family membrane protein [Paenibacillus sp. BC26]SFS83398.1 Conserved membrane protein YqhR [Paenibacillus sp. BC26]
MRKVTTERRKHNSPSDYNGKPHTNPFAYCLKLGFFAGVIWGLLHWLLYAIHFTKVMPGFLLEPFFQQSFLKSGWGHFAGIAAFTVFSIIATFIYKVLLGRLGGPWAGVFYGLVWWLLLFMTIGPVMQMMDPVNKIGYDTLFTEGCFFTLWGLFIGYTIAFEFTDEASREPVGAL